MRFDEYSKVADDNDDEVVVVVEEEQEEEVEVVRIVINPSILQRFVHSSGYYFHDDIPMPSSPRTNKTLSNQIMMPSQPPKNEGDTFRELWIRFCTQLARNQDEFNNRYRSILLVLSGCWILIVGGLLLDMIYRLDGMTYEAWLMRFLTLTFFCLVPFSLPTDSMMMVLGSDNNKDVLQTSTQQLVDEMSPLFLELGYHVDCVHDNRRLCFPRLVYVRFEKFSEAASLGDISLAQAMQEMQQQARQDHIDAVLEQRKEDRDSQVAESYLIFGIIRVETLESWKQPIIGCGSLLALYYTFYLIFWFFDEYYLYY